MIDYRVRSISLLNLVNDVRNERLIPDAYFQRNLVWRELHKKEFIKTILLGYPFPQIFISQGKVNVDDMSTSSCIIDGQQRLNAIAEYIDGVFDVEGRHYSELTESEKSDFLKYEIAVIALDLDNDDPKVLEIFKRINRTSNSLTGIEKMASEYAASDFLLVARHLSGQIDINENSNEDDIRESPNIPIEFFTWARKSNVERFSQLIITKGIFTQHEVSRKVQLMHVLNIMSTVLVGFYNRNDKTTENLNDYSTEFAERDELVWLLNDAADSVLKLKLKSKSYFYNKANIFTLIVAITEILKKGISLDLELLKQRLVKFEADIPEEYKRAATEGVNSTGARLLRNKHISKILEDSSCH